MQEVWVQSLVRELGSHKNIKKWEQYCNKLKTLKIVNIKKKKRIWHKFKSELFPLLEVDLGQVYST